MLLAFNQKSLGEGSSLRLYSNIRYDIVRLTVKLFTDCKCNVFTSAFIFNCKVWKKYIGAAG